MFKIPSSALCIAVLLASPSLAEDLIFTLTNTTSLDITGFYTSPTDVENWEEDVFNGGALASGDSSEITIADGRSQCDYDLKVLFEDGDELTDSANLCDMSEYVVSEE